MNKICLLSASESSSLQLCAEKPRCSNHTHTTRWAADEMVKSGDAQWIGKTGYRLAVGARKFWKKVTERYHVCGRGDNAHSAPLGFATMQLVNK